MGVLLLRYRCKWSSKAVHAVCEEIVLRQVEREERERAFKAQI